MGKKEVKVKVTFDDQLRAAIQKHGDNHVDIIIDGKKAYGIYHSRHDSFSVTDSYELSSLGGIQGLKKYEKEFEGLCVCES